MKKLALASLLLSMFALGSTSVLASTQEPKLQEVEAVLKKNNPDIPSIKSIRATPVSGIYEVIVNEADLFYSDKDGKHLFFGNMIKSENGKKINLTEERIQELTMLDFKSLNFADAITRKIGTGKNIIVVFEDPNCGFCKKLQPELARLNNVTIHSFVIPILGESSRDVTRAVICSKDKLKELENYYKTGVAPTVSQLIMDKCDTSSIDRNVSLSKKIKVNGTPAIFFENGRSIKGYAPYDKLLETMSAPSLRK